MNKSLLGFLDQVKLDVQNKTIEDMQILHLISFYCNYTGQERAENLDNKINNNNNNSEIKSFAPSINDFITAGIVFYDAVTNKLDIKLDFGKFDEESEEEAKGVELIKTEENKKDDDVFSIIKNLVKEDNTIVSDESKR